MVKNIFLHELKHFYPIKKILYLLFVVVLLGFGILGLVFTIAETPQTLAMIIETLIISGSSFVGGIAALKPMFSYITEPFQVAPIIARYISPRKINALLKEETFVFNDDYEDAESYHFLAFSKNWMYVNGYFIPFHAVAIMALASDSRKSGGRYHHIYYLFVTFINGKTTKIKLRSMTKYLGQSEPYFFTDDSFLEYFIKQVSRNTDIAGINLGYRCNIKQYNKLMEPVLCYLKKGKITVEDIKRSYPYREEIKALIQGNFERGKDYIAEWTKYSNRADAPYKLLSNSILLSDGSTKAYALCDVKELHNICNKLHIQITKYKVKDATFMLNCIHATYEENQVQHNKQRKTDYLTIIVIVILSVIAFFLPIVLRIN